MAKTSALPVLLSELHEDPKNPRKISPTKLERLKKSIGKFGDISGITYNVTTGQLVSGHQRVKVLIEEHSDLKVIVTGGDKKPKGSIQLPDGSDFPIRIVRWPKEKQRQANIVANSKELAGEYTDDLQDQLREIERSDAEAFGELGLNDLLIEHEAGLNAAASGADAIPPAPANPKTKPGDIYQLGAHRLICADATNAAEVARLMDGKRADMVFTDPPYAIFGSSTGIAADITDDKMIRPFFREVVKGCVNVLKQFGHCYIFCDWRSWASWWDVTKASGLTGKNMIVWDKGSGLGAMFANCHELVLFSSHTPLQKQMSKKRSGERCVNGQKNVWEFHRAGGEDEERVHNAQKPVELVKHAIECSSDHGQLVVDFFGGSGTTMIAAEDTGRQCYMMEIEPSWCDVIVARWEAFTEKKARLIRKADSK